MIDVRLADGSGKGQSADVMSNGAVLTSSVPVPAGEVRASNAQAIKNLSGKLLDGASADMTIDGSTTAVNFDLASSDDRIKTVVEIRLLFHSTTMDITNNEARRFGPVAAPGLANGLKLQAIQGGITTEMFIDPVQVIGEFYNYADGGLNNGIINDKDAVAASTDLLVVIIRLAAPVVLMPGSNDVVRVIVADDLTGLLKFETFYYGTQQTL